MGLNINPCHSWGAHTDCPVCGHDVGRDRKLRELEAKMRAIEPSYEGIAAKLEMYRRPVHREFYIDVKDVGSLYTDYLEHVHLLLLEVARLEKQVAMSDAGRAKWYAAGLEAAAKVAEQYWRQGGNVYARHSGRAVESRIRALMQPAKET